MVTGGDNSSKHPLNPDHVGFSSSSSHASLLSTTSSARSTAFHYPIYGLIYLLTSPSMVCSVICAILVGITIAITALILLLTMTLQSQSRSIANMFGVHGEEEEGDDESSTTGTATWWSYVIAIFAVLFETTLITLLLLKIIHGKSQKKIFVQTMRLQNQWKQGSMVEPSGIDINCCKLSFVISLVTFPLHIVFPLVGTVIYCLLNGRLTGWEYMDMYFHAIHMSGIEQRQEVLRGSSSSLSVSCLNIYNNPYTQFGFICGLLESIPIFGPSIFPLSNACGAALYACELERSRRKGGTIVGNEPSNSTTVTPYQSYHNTAKMTKGE